MASDNAQSHPRVVRLFGNRDRLRPGQFVIF